MKSEQDQKEQATMIRLLEYLFQQFRFEYTNDKIISDLVDEGIKKEDAESIVLTARDMYRNKEFRETMFDPEKSAAAQRGWKRMWTGLLWLALGSIITFITYTLAAGQSYGGRYMICYGAIGMGGIYFLWGLFEWLINR